MANIELTKYLHQRIIDKCVPLYEGNHYSQVAFESMKQVELALKEKAEIGNKLYGVKLVNHLFGQGEGVKLKVPLGNELQEEAKKYFDGAFSYYRNYVAHDGSKIDEIISIRVMIIASELLYLIGASSISFAEIGGVKGLVKSGIFDSESQINDLLIFLSEQQLPNEVYDGMFEQLAEKGYSDKQYQSMFDFDLIEYHSKMMDHAFPGEPEDWDSFGWLELTHQGRQVLNQAKNA